MLTKAYRGGGGRSSNAGLTVTLFGSSGFLGRYLVSRLGKKGVQCVIPYRGDELLVRHLRPLGDVGQIVPLFFRLKEPQEVSNVLQGSQAVVNMIGRSYETSNFSFKDVHVEGARTIAKEARERGIEKFVHVSALGASLDSPSDFLKSKAEGELAVRQEFPNATIVRPAVMFGAEDRFLTRIAYLHFNPLFYGNPVLNGGKQKVSPVYVGDVAQGIINVLNDPDNSPKTYEFLGPKQYTYLQLVNYFGEVCHRPVQPITYPKFAMDSFARLMELWPPSPVITRQEILRMTMDEKGTGEPTLEDLGVKTATIESLILTIWRSFKPPFFIGEPAPEPSRS